MNEKFSDDFAFFDKEEKEIFGEAAMKAFIRTLTALYTTGKNINWQRWAKPVNEAFSYVCRKHGCSRNGFLAWKLGLTQETRARVSARAVSEQLAKEAEKRGVSKAELIVTLFWQELLELKQAGDEEAKEHVVKLLKLWHEYLKELSRREAARGRKVAESVQKSLF